MTSSPLSSPAPRPWWRRVQLWPRSLAGQLLLSLLIALVVAQLVTILVFSYERSNVALTTTRGQVLERTASLVRVLNLTDNDLHRRVIRAAEGPGILFTLNDTTNLLVPMPGTPEAGLADRLERRAGLPAGSVRIGELNYRVFDLGRSRSESAGDQDDRPIQIAPPNERPEPFDDRDLSKQQRRELIRRWRDNGAVGQPPFAHSSERRGGEGWRPNGNKRPDLSRLDMAIAVPLNNGKWLQIRTGVPTPQAEWGRPLLISLGVTASFILLVVVLTVRKLTAPLRALEGASRQLGRGETVEPLREEGPKEVRNTIIAFNAMQHRLMRFVQDRTRMLAAVSHDLRTPITTLRLRAEFLDDEETREKILATLEEMQTMTDAVLAFAREDAASEDTKEVDVAALLSSMAEDYVELGKDVSFTGPDSLTYSCRPVGLKRALTNLVENALRYAGDARISLHRSAKWLSIEVCDTGPGIPEEKLSEVFAPFFRVEGSRNLETGGVGLGLSITRTIIRSHGGDVKLENRPSGGLKASISLPL